MGRCSQCKAAGASIGCGVRACRVTMHFRCAGATGWDFASQVSFDQYRWLSLTSVLDQYV
jgi:hypothetical protein